MIARCLVVVAGILLASGIAPAHQQKDDKDALQGEWTVVSTEVNGKDYPANKGKKLVVKGDEWTAPGGGEFKFKVDGTKTPKQLDLYLSSKIVDLTWAGIFKIEGDTLTFCRPSTAGDERPKEFKGGEGMFLMVLKRPGK